MGLFEKKYCDICGEKISFLGNRKLEDGNMCSHCAKLISPFMTDRRQTTVAQMKEHLSYRESNKTNLANFYTSETYGNGTKVYIDRAKGNFVVSYRSPESWKKENPDVIPLSEVSSCNLDIRENREEIYTHDSEGNSVSYTPPRYTYDYDFYLKIFVTNKWFNEIEIKLNVFDVEGMNSQKYHEHELLGQQIISALTGNPVNITPGSGYGTSAAFGGMGGFANAFVNQVAQNASQVQYQQQTYQQPQQNFQQAPQQQNTVQQGPWQCPNCQGQNNGQFCEYCGTKRP